MKLTLTTKWSLLILASFSFFCQSCLEDDCEATLTYIEQTQVIVDISEIRVDITTSESRAIEKPGKIYTYGKYIFLNESREGLHIIDNSDPTAPQTTGFINIPGNLDMAIRDGVLYADSYTDLLAIDVSDPSNPNLLCRLESVYNQYEFWDNNGSLVYYEDTERTKEVNCQDPNFGQDFFEIDGIRFENSEVSLDAAGGVAKDGSVGTGGSTARFTIAKNHLYAVDQSSLHVFDLDEPQKPILQSSVGLRWGIETIWPYKDLLFIGSNAGMFIFNNENPSEPYELSRFAHATACDPVVADDKYAYVTLRDGSFCESFTNQLDVIDIKDLKSPFLVESYPMDNPHGLSIVGEHLYICEGKHGLKVFNASDPKKIDDNQLDHIKGIVAYDIIPLSEDHIIVVGDQGLYQFDTTDKENLKELSLISVPR